MNKPDIHLQGWEAQRKQNLLAIISQAYDIVKAANKHTSSSTKVKTFLDYKDTAALIFGRHPASEKLVKPEDINTVINKVKESGTVSTLRKYAISIKRVSAYWVIQECKRAEAAISNRNLVQAEKILSSKSFHALLSLSQLNPADYQVGWIPERKRQSKKKSLRGLRKDWREYMSMHIREGQFKIPAIAAFLTGCRPEELEKGITFVRIEDRLRVRIQGAKITRDAGQPWRCFDIAQHPIKQLMLDYMDTQSNPRKVVVKVGVGNSLTTYLRAQAERIFPAHNQSITAYSSRHAMAADCKKASRDGLDKDLASMVLGHRVDKTASYYGSLFQSGGISMAPSNVKISRAVKNKLKQRLGSRNPPRAAVKSRGARMY